MTIKKILIISTKCGGGHIAVSQALKQKIVNASHISHFDFEFIYIEDYSDTFYQKITNLYNSICINFPIFYNYLYKIKLISQKNKKKLTTIKPASLNLRFKKLIKLINFSKPYTCLTLFPRGASVLASLKKNKLIKDCYITHLITDYSLFRSYIFPEIDIYFASCEEIYKFIRNTGFKNKVIISGIPIRKEFLTNGSGVKEEYFLISAGYLGCKSAIKIIKQIRLNYSNQKIIVLTGQANRAITKFVKGKKNIKIVSSRNPSILASLYSKAKLNFIKPGGIAITEMCALGISNFILYHNQGGQENYNLNYFTQKNIGTYIKYISKKKQNEERKNPHFLKIRSIIFESTNVIIKELTSLTKNV